MVNSNALLPLGRLLSLSVVSAVIAFIGVVALTPAAAQSGATGVTGASGASGVAASKKTRAVHLIEIDIKLRLSDNEERSFVEDPNAFCENVTTDFAKLTQAQDSIDGKIKKSTDKAERLKLAEQLSAVKIEMVEKKYPKKAELCAEYLQAQGKAPQPIKGVKQ
jgi:hypothetical protein